MSPMLAEPALDAQRMLEWPRIQERLIALCATPYGRARWQDAAFLPTADSVADHLADVSALRQMLDRWGEPAASFRAQEDVSPSLARALPGATLGARELAQMLITLRDGAALAVYAQKALKKTLGEEAASVSPFCSGLMDFSWPQDLLETLETAIDEQGEVLDGASETLARLRGEARRQRARIHERLQAFLNSPEVAGALQERLVTERDGRATLMIQAGFKSAVPGVVHGASASGATLYVEPHALVGLNNALRELQDEIQAEIARIYRNLTAAIAESRDALHVFLETLGALDRRLAAARLSRLLEAAAPRLLNESAPRLSLKRARHPLLLLQARDRAEIIANDVDLGAEDVRTLVITGPNAGGKTVFLKLLGLFALMTRAGLHLSADEGSEMTLFDPILADIGDQQSLERNLSTFSAHVAQLTHFLTQADAPPDGLRRALILMDEIAAGTDPAEGAALARATLAALHQSGAITVVTTHLGELKLEARACQGYANASVEFDAHRLQPTYRLLMGAPGASNAIAIAERLGLPSSVVVAARACLSAPQRDAAALIESLELKNRQADEALTVARVAREEAQAAFTQADALRRQIREEKRQTLQTYKTGLQQRLHALDAELKAIQRQLRERADDADAVSALAADWKRTDAAAREFFNAATQEWSKEAAHEPLPALAPGDGARCAQWGLEGEILAVSGDGPDAVATLRAGNLTVNVALSELTPLGPEPARKRRAKPLHISASARRDARPTGDPSPQEGADRPVPTLECHLLGMRVEAALAQVVAFLDRAALENHAAVRIIHGHGGGALKRAVRDYLKTSPYAARFYPGAPADGGDGQTIVELADRPA